MTVKKILDLCEKHGFLKQLVTEGTNKELLKIGPVGGILLENLKTEWFYSMVINRDHSVFYNKDSFIDTYQYAKEVCLEKLPFGIAEILGPKTSNDLHSDKITSCNSGKQFLEENNLVLRTTMFVSPSSAIQFFHQWQRLRKTWWRKFSASPSRYSLTDIQSDKSGNQSVEIKAEYSWNAQLIESLKLASNAHDQLNFELLQTKDGRKGVQAHYISSDISLSNMLLNALYDAYDEPLFQGEPRPLLRLHRKLAPYKISFAVANVNNSATTEELAQLALYLCRQLRKNQISCLLLPSSTRNTLESQWCHYDQLGVPYTVLLNQNTLRNGIVLLRSRDTTLKEQVHVSNLSTYIQKLFQNY